MKKSTEMELRALMESPEMYQAGVRLARAHRRAMKAQQEALDVWTAMGEEMAKAFGVLVVVSRRPRRAKRRTA